MQATRGTGIIGLMGPLLLFILQSTAVLGDNYSEQMNLRYAPYADWGQAIRLDSLGSALANRVWWQSPEAMRRARTESDRPLSGLHLALDPGHIGGEWAEAEGRHFQIGSGDFPVREGELVLEVARRVRDQLVELGAEVTLLREVCQPLNPKPPEAYLSTAAQRVEAPKDASWASLLDYGLALRDTMQRLSIVTGELVERARLINNEVQPDALISLHINAAPWPTGEDGHAVHELVAADHTHVLIFGCLSDAELSSPRQQEQLITKLTNGSGDIELKLGQALGEALGAATQLPPSNYAGKNAVRLEGYTPYLWARNLMLLRYVECPAVLLEPYIANSKSAYTRIQHALKLRAEGASLTDDDILVEYADAVVGGVLRVYGPEADD